MFLNPANPKTRRFYQWLKRTLFAIGLLLVPPLVFFVSIVLHAFDQKDLASYFVYSSVGLLTAILVYLYFFFPPKRWAAGETGDVQSGGVHGHAYARRGAVHPSHLQMTGKIRKAYRDIDPERLTVVIDGNNLYHFGADQCRQGAGIRHAYQPLLSLAAAFRDHEYSIVCFFDANIYHTIEDLGDMPANARHEEAILQRLFNLRSDEIFQVPSGVQADDHILEYVSRHPKAFILSNDRFRQYGNQYAFMDQDTSWRKSIYLKEGRLTLQHSPLQSDIRLLDYEAHPLLN